MKNYKDFVNVFLNEESNIILDINVSDELVCVGSGVVSITRGDQARSADALVGNTFTVSDVTRNKHWIFGKLNIRGAHMERNPNLSGKDPDQLKKIPIPLSGIEYAIRREDIYDDPERDTENDFFASWEKK